MKKEFDGNGEFPSEKRESGSFFMKDRRNDDGRDTRRFSADRETRPYGERTSRPRREGFRSAPSGERNFSRRPYGERPDRGERRSYNPRFDRDGRLKEVRTDRASFHKEGEGPREGGFRSRNNFHREGQAPYRGRENNGGERPYGSRPATNDRPFRPRREFDANRTAYPRPADRDNRERREGGFPRSGENRRFGAPGGYRNNGGSERRDHNHRAERREAPRYGERRFERNDRFAGKRPVRRPEDRNQRMHVAPEYPVPRDITGPVRLNKFIAMSGICSRREADDFIKSGVVSVNGNVVSEMGFKVNPSDEVRFNGEPIRGEKKVYILMNKPKGFVTTLEDPFAEKTVIDLLKGECKERVYPVGRLDKNTLGVLLLTNDGELTKQLTHPSYEKRKIYHVYLDKPITEEHMEAIANGFELEDGFIFADEITKLEGKNNEVGIELHSGRNRIVRRIFEHFGYKVNKLDRVYFAGLTKKGLQRGFWRYLTPMEVSRLKSGAYE